MTRDKWFKLTPEARQIWDQLDDHPKAVILAPTERPNNYIKHKVNLHEISAYDYLLANLHSSSDHTPLEMDTLTDAVGSEPPSPEASADTSQVLANAAKQTKSTPNPADIQQVLSNTLWPDLPAPPKVMTW